MTAELPSQQTMRKGCAGGHMSAVVICEGEKKEINCEIMCDNPLDTFFSFVERYATQRQLG